MDVSFILPSYNRREILRRCLGELYALDYRFPFEVLVMDNGSDDGSVEMVASAFPQVRLTALGENMGARSRNLALEQARGRYVVMLDDDSHPTPGAVETGMEVFAGDRRGRVGCIAFNIRRADGSYESAGMHSAFTGCGAMFRRDIFDEVGGYPDDYLFYVEEYDLSCRLTSHGYAILNFKELEVVHLKTAVNRDFARVMVRLVRNNLLVWSKYLPPDLAARQIATELWRYEKIARKEGVLPAYRQGLELGDRLRRRYRTDRRAEIGREAAKRMLLIPGIRRAAARLRERIGPGRVIVLCLGKSVHFVLDALRDAGLTPLAFVDDNPYMHEEEFLGLPVCPRSRLERDDYDAILIGSSSLALNDTLEAWVRRHLPGCPVERLCHYHRLEDHAGGAARPGPDGPA